MTFFFEFSLRPFEVIEVEWRLRLIFWGCNLQLLQSIWNFGSSPRNGKVDLCTTNGSIVLIYLTLLNFLLHYLQEYSKIGNIAKSNKSELCNKLPFRGEEPNFQEWLQNFEATAWKFNIDRHSTSTIPQ